MRMVKKTDEKAKELLEEFNISVYVIICNVSEKERKEVGVLPGHSHLNIDPKQITSLISRKSKLFIIRNTSQNTST